jgi:hypothetical protein
MLLLRNPPLKFRGMVGRIRCGEAAIVKAQFVRTLTDVFFHQWPPY